MTKLCECGCERPAPIAPRNDRSQGWVKGQAIRFVNGHVKGNFRHGGGHTPEYRAYTDAKARCTNSRYKDFKNYGGRGIRFLFAGYEVFIACLGPRPAGLTLDRIDNDGHYEPGNVRWATRLEQRHNRRPSRRKE